MTRNKNDRRVSANLSALISPREPHRSSSAFQKSRQRLNEVSALSVPPLERSEWKNRRGGIAAGGEERTDRKIV